jgi:hypothetical protein
MQEKEALLKEEGIPSFGYPVSSFLWDPGTLASQLLTSTSWQGACSFF